MTDTERFKQIVCSMYDTYCKKNHDSRSTATEKLYVYKEGLWKM